MPTFLVVSPNGYGNVGDDICAYSGAYLAKSLSPKNKAIISSPPFNERLAAKADVLMLSGGGVIYDRSEPNVENYMQYLDYGQQNHKVTAVVGVGVQGVVTDWGKKRYREVLNKTDLVTVRSPGDKKLLDEIKIKKVIATQDLGLLADEWVRKPWRQPKLAKTHKPRLALVLLDVRFLLAYKNGNQKLRTYIKVVEDNLEHLAQEFDVWLFAHSKDDEAWRNEMAKKYGMHVVPYKNIKDFPRFFAYYQQMDLVVGVRFHSVVLGLLAGKPVVGIGSGGAKLFRLAASSPTLKKQCFALGDTAKLKELFNNMRAMYDDGKFEVLPPSELKSLKTAAQQNRELLKKIVKS